MRLHFFTNEILPILNGTNIEIIEYLRRIGILERKGICKFCEIEMNTVKYKRNKDLFAFRCLNKTCNGFKKYLSIRINSIFENFRFDLKVGIKILWKWLGDNAQEEVIREVDIDRSSLIEFYFLLRQCCIRFYDQNSIILGGPDVFCQVDESLFRHKPKNYRGRATANEMWVFWNSRY